MLWIILGIVFTESEVKCFDAWDLTSTFGATWADAKLSAEDILDNYVVRSSKNSY